MLTVAGDTTKLFSVTAACQGLEVKLESDIVNFGTVCLGSRMTKLVTMYNTGDIGAKVSALLQPD